jgi:D-serine deaminase-like pyridoxal phosphate-dependent protein
LSLPLLLLKQSALDNNRRWMQSFLQTSGLQLAPHGKTPMAPQLFQLQLADGAWGLTCANRRPAANLPPIRRSAHPDGQPVGGAQTHPVCPG